MHADQHVLKRTYRATFGLFGGLAFVGGVIGFGVLLVVSHPKPGAPELLSDQMIGAAGLPILLMILFHLARCRVTTSASALTVVNPIWRYVCPWHQITDVVVGRAGGMQIVLRDDKTVDVFGFGNSVIGWVTHGIRARKARDGIKAAMAGASNHEPDSPVTSSLDVQWKATLALWAAFTVLSFVGWLLAPHHVLA